MPNTGAGKGRVPGLRVGGGHCCRSPHAARRPAHSRCPLGPDAPAGAFPGFSHLLKVALSQLCTRAAEAGELRATVGIMGLGSKPQVVPSGGTGCKLRLTQGVTRLDWVQLTDMARAVGAGPQLFHTALMLLSAECTVRRERSRQAGTATARPGKARRAQDGRALSQADLERRWDAEGAPCGGHSVIRSQASPWESQGGCPVALDSSHLVRSLTGWRP